MDESTLFSSSKWAIIELLGVQALSPLQLAERLNTTVANISQQLRILEAYGVVSKSRVANHARGKPRLAYRLSTNNVFVAAPWKKTPLKSFFKADSYEKLLLSIWSEFSTDDNSELKQELSSWVMKIASLLEWIHSIYYDANKSRLILVADKSKFFKLKQSISVKLSKLISFEFISVSKVDFETFELTYNQTSGIMLKGECVKKLFSN